MTAEKHSKTMDVICVLFLVVVLLPSYPCSPEESEYKLCYPQLINMDDPGGELVLKGSSGQCSGCAELQNCTTLHGSIQIQGFGFLKSPADDPLLKKDFYFPKLTEITGYLLISLLGVTFNLKEVFPNLAVIRGGRLFLDYSLVIYMNDGLRRIHLPSLSVILSGGIRIEKNMNLCYAKTIRWKSILRANSEDSSIVISANNNDCYDLCYNGKCFPPAGHGASGKQYCWGPGTQTDYSCQNLCNTKCGEAGCVRGTSEICCHFQCLGGCTKINSKFHCNSCKKLRLKSGECVSKCPESFFETSNFECVRSCPRNQLKWEGKCVADCPAGYIKKEKGFFFFKTGECKKCEEQSCPRVCKADGFKSEILIDSLSAVRKYKGCTVIDSNLSILIRGGGGSISRELQENLGMLEEVRGYILIRESRSLVSLKFLKNLKVIQPTKTFSIQLRTFVPYLYNKRYSLTIMDNPKLEQMWDFNPKLTISAGGVLVRMNPRLCPNKITPLLDILKKDNSTRGRDIDISETTNGNDVACQVKTINLTLTEEKSSFFSSCAQICVLAKWDEVKISEDYRNVLFYTLNYREAPHTDITEFDDIDECSSKAVWQKKEVPVTKEAPAMNVSVYNTKQHTILRQIGSLKPHTLYAMYVEMVTLNKKGARSKLKFIKTRETVPSPVVGLDASFLDHQSLLVKWQLPLYPNGNITKYVITYQPSDYSVWQQDNIDWCTRQVLTRRETDSESSNKDKDNTGACNVTCDCDKDKEVVKPEKQAAIFAKEFQDELLKRFFTKDKDDADPTKKPTTKPNNITSTAFPFTHITTDRSNCSNDSDPMCSTTPTESTSKTPIASSKPSTILPANTTDRPTNATPITPTKKPVIIVREVNGTKQEYLISALRHFVDYRITVCACTSAGCSKPSDCSSTKGRTGRKDQADNLDGPLKVNAQNSTKRYNISWIPPQDPNSLVLKYDIEIMHGSREAPEVICRKSSAPTWLERKGLPGSYSTRVRAITPAGNGSWSNVVVFYLSSEDTDGTSNEQYSQELDIGMIVGASLATCSVIILACGIAVWYITRKRYEEKQIHTVLYASVNPEYMNSSDVYIADEWEVPREKIKLIRELGQGSFGMVYEGEAIDIVKGQPRCRVAVKTVSENASVKDRIEFLQEASIMKAFHCYHVVELIGVVSDGQPTLVIMELMHNGDLKNHLRSRRPGENGDLPPPTLNEMLQMAGEIADGMGYLASRKFVHRDLAARNCMVNENLTVKIGDFGMTRDIYETDYYRKGGKGLLPVRWMAPESLKDGVFTSPSDVWSYGVVLWEMVTLASQPYPGKSNEEVLKFVVDGGVMEKPPEAPEQFFELMALCWQFKPKTRPTFLTIINMIEDKLSEDFKKNSFYSTLPRAHLGEMLRSRSFHIPRQRAETIQNEKESSA